MRKKFNYNYFSLSDLKFKKNELSFLKLEDIEKIRNWRNNQIKFLRQESKISKEIQISYFRNIVSQELKSKKPNLILFGLIKEKKLVGYGGLVNINWGKKIAELSILFNPKIKEKEYKVLFYNFVKLAIEFSKKYNIKILETFTFPFRKNNLQYLKEIGFVKKKIFKKRTKKNEKFFDEIVQSYKVD